MANNVNYSIPTQTPRKITNKSTLMDIFSQTLTFLSKKNLRTINLCEGLKSTTKYQLELSKVAANGTFLKKKIKTLEKTRKKYFTMILAWKVIFVGLILQQNNVLPRV